MSEEIVPYRTKNSPAEFDALKNQVLALVEKARAAGLEPTEVWLGRRELEICDAANTTTEANCYTAKERTLAGLVVRRSHENGVRVGVTLANVRGDSRAERVESDPLFVPPSDNQTLSDQP